MVLRGTIAFIFVVALVNSGCGKKVEHSAFHDSYEFSVSGCETKRQVFEGGNEAEVLQALCAALQDDARNNYCAEETREQYFRQKCVGQEWKPVQTLPY